MKIADMEREGSGIWRRVAAVVVLAIGISAVGMSTLREPQAILSPGARSNGEIASGLALMQQGSSSAIAAAKTIAARHPLQSSSFVILGMATMRDHRDRVAQVERLMSEAVRRQPSLQLPRLWLAAAYSSRKDYNRSIDQLDTVLSSSGALDEAAAPLLQQALADPRYRDHLVQQMRKFPRWRTSLLVQAIKTGSLPQSTIESLLAEPRDAANASALATERQAYLEWLVRRGDLATARAAFVGYEPGVGKQAVFDPRFKRLNVGPPFGWKLGDGDEDYAQAVKGASDGDVTIRLHAGTRRDATLLEQYTALTAGAWKLRLAARDGGLASPGQLKLELACQGSPEALASRELGALSTQRSVVELPVNVPANCPIQRLTITSRESDPPSETEIEVFAIEAVR